MSVTSNVVLKLKQLFYNSDADNNDVSDAIDAMNDFYLTARIPTGSDGNAYTAAANSSLCLSVPVNAKLVSAYFGTTTAHENSAANTKTITVATNGVTAVSYNSDAASNVAANGIQTLSVNSENSFVDAGEVVLVAYGSQAADASALNGNLVLGFRRV